MSALPSRQLKNLAGLTAASLGALASQQAHAASPQFDISGSTQRVDLSQNNFTFAHENVLGTSLELVVEGVADSEAIHCQQTVFQEIERLRQILSTYDSSSEISRVRAGAAVESRELAEVLLLYQNWAGRTQGAISAHLGGLIQIWKEAAQTGKLPDVEELKAASRSVSALNVDALGKGYIIDQAVAVARRIAPSGMLNIGGDIRAWGNSSWLIGVADPLHPAENAPLLAQFILRNAAVATSGGYARYMNIAGQKFSHILDPRTLMPAVSHASATVVAANAVTANALSTAACLLDPTHAAALVLNYGLGHLIVDAASGVFSGGILAVTDSLPSTPAPSPAAPAGTTTVGKPTTAQPATDAPWPKDFQVTINLALGVGSSTQGQTTPGGFGFRRGGGGGGMKRPYVAIWIENAQLKTVRSLTILGSNPRYQYELTNWFKASGGNPTLLRAITRATRPAGQYQFVWDGTDDHGKALPQGTYAVYVEINREHGVHALTTASIACGGTEPATSKLKATAETDASTVAYGLKDKPAAPTTPGPLTAPAKSIPLPAVSKSPTLAAASPPAGI